MIRRRAATIVDVARLAGVSRTTASDALGGRGRVSAATRLAVEDAARQLGYRPNTAARSLRTATTGTIGIHLPEAMTRIEYYLQTVYGALEQAARHEVDVTLITSTRLASGQAPPSVDGVILLDPLVDDPVATRLLHLDLPIVTLEPALGAAASGVVSASHERAFRDLLDHLEARGSRLPGFLASPAVTDWGVRMQREFRTWCEERSITPVVVERPFGSPPRRYAEAIGALLERQPDLDAVVCGPDGSAAVALDVLAAAGRRPGDDVLVAAIVDNSALAQTDPPVTAIDLQPRLAGELCVGLLLELIAGTQPPGTVVDHPIEIRYRASTTGRPSTEY